MRQNRFWLCVAPVAICALDQSLTLWFQHPEYWRGNYAFANESNPLFSWLLSRHPLAFEAGILAWVSFFCMVLIHAPKRFAMAASIALIIGHTWGAATWLIARVNHGYWLCIAIFFIADATVVLTWEQQMRGEHVQRMPNDEH